MSKSDSLDSRALLSALRDAPIDEAAVLQLRGRVHARLSASILGLTSAHASGLRQAQPTSASSSPSGLARASANKSLIAATIAPVFALGVATGVFIDHLQQRSAGPRVLHAPAATAISAVTPPIPPEAAEKVLTPDALQALPLESSNRHADRGPVDSGWTLRAERGLLDEARKALARGEPGESLAAIDQHARRFPHGILAEEREALAVRTLVALGNTDAARARAESFHQRFPNSLFTPAVETAITPTSNEYDRRR